MAVLWYFDFISPFSYLQWQKVRRLHEDGTLEAPVTPVPLMFGAVLGAHGQKGPAEIAGKREFTYRHVLWQARREGVPLEFPPAHPFNPLPALRLCIAAGSTHAAVDAVFSWIWRDGRAADSVEAIAPLVQALGIDPAVLGEDGTKAALRAKRRANPEFLPSLRDRVADDAIEPDGRQDQGDDRKPRKQRRRQSLVRDALAHDVVERAHAVERQLVVETAQLPPNRWDDGHLVHRRAHHEEH